MDTFLEERLEKYDKWLANGRISFSSKVIPVQESIDARQWVLPTAQVLELLRQARFIALQNCECRSFYRRCDNPLEVCLILNESGEKLVKQGLARQIAFEEAGEVLRSANENGLVHLSLYQPDHELYALCSCCACCCHDLQLVQVHHRSDLMAHSDYIAVTDPDACIHCGKCVERCLFGARTWEAQQMVYHAELCYGCGLCVTTCPVNATVMQRREVEKLRS